MIQSVQDLRRKLVSDWVTCDLLRLKRIHENIKSAIICVSICYGMDAFVLGWFIQLSIE